MRKTLINLEKTTSSNKPSALGGAGKGTGYFFTGLAWVFSRTQKGLMEFDAWAEPSRGVKKTYRDTWEIGLTDANDAIRKLEKALTKVDARIAEIDPALKPKKLERLIDAKESAEKELERQVLLMKEFRKKLYK